MIGEGVLLEALADPRITAVLSVSRKPIQHTHPKLQTYVVKDFAELQIGDPQLSGYDACFYCAGVSAVGMNEAEYTYITYHTTLHFAKALSPSSSLSFIYVSGGGTDSTEQSRMMWARVKGRTENDLMKLPFKQVFGFRIGFVKPTAGQHHVLPYYKYISWLFPLISVLLPDMYNTMREVSQAMIYLSRHSYPGNVIYVKDIHAINKIKANI